MFQFGDLFQWERFITPSIIKIFYWLALAIAVLGGLQSVFGGLGAIFAGSLIPGLLMIIAGVLFALAGIIAARIAAEFILIVFRISEHLGAIRSQGEQQ